MKYKILLIVLLCCACFTNVNGQKRNKGAVVAVEKSDRQYWCEMMYKISAPVLEIISKGELKKNMTAEVSPSWGNQNKNIMYLETYARLMAGLAPWLALPDDDTPEGAQRKQLREWALRGYANAVDPENPDYFWWKGGNQVLCDASFLAQSFLRAPEALWEPLDSVTKERYIAHFKALKWVRPAYNNWLLFRAMTETFLMSIGEDYDAFVIETAIRKMEEWYLGDGWYSDGAEYSLDYYNGYVMHPMLVEILDAMQQKKKRTPISFDLAFRRMQRYNELIERLISPEATYPAVGRSMTYRMGAFQTLALSAWKYELPKSMTNGQVRNALTSVMKRMFSMEGNFDDKGFLQLGFVGHQPGIADSYTNAGSLYLTSLVFLPLGLPADHPFWTDPVQEWTSQKAWGGKPFIKDYHQSVKR